jgi:hypothetical protein
LNQEKSIANTHDTALEIQNRQVAQEAVVKDTKSILAKLYDLVAGDVVPQLKSLLDMANKVWKSNLQISSILMSRCETQLMSPDLRHTWLQPPVRLEDPLRRYIPIPSEYSFSMMQAVILAQFESGPGSTIVRSGDYEIANSKDCNQVVTADSFTGFIPGMDLRMAIIMYQQESFVVQSTMESCLNPECGAQDCADAEGGGKTWYCR